MLPGFHPPLNRSLNMKSCRAISSCAFEFEKTNKQSLKIDPGTQKNPPGNAKCNKTITALHFVQYYTITALERDQHEVLWSRVQQY
jgi:hypothetical protein